MPFRLNFELQKFKELRTPGCGFLHQQRMELYAALGLSETGPPEYGKAKVNRRGIVTCRLSIISKNF